ncbi:MAG: hypothetical protein HYU57_05620 [Micavibrio aeruginosavorus]|nr:hypothetical protein [Micavibrio aeruginosavorus]
MRKCFLTLLMFLMVAPGLACGPFMPAHKAQAAAPTTGCHEMAEKNVKPLHDNTSGPTFFKDCQHVDLQNADFHADLKKPDDAGKTFTVSWAAILPPAANMPVTGDAIRGPPPDRIAFSLTRPDILLTTQRFRE